MLQNARVIGIETKLVAERARSVPYINANDATLAQRSIALVPYGIKLFVHELKRALPVFCSKSATHGATATAEELIPHRNHRIRRRCDDEVDAAVGQRAHVPSIGKK